MKASTLSYIKKELRRLADLYDVIESNYNKEKVYSTFPVMTFIQVILNNMAHNATGTVNYNHEVAVADLYTNLATLKAINEYNEGDYITHFPYNEANDIINLNDMADDILEDRIL